MKRFLSLFLIIVLVFSMVACSNDNSQNNEAVKIKFSQTVEELKEYENNIVTINGFISLLSPLDGSLVYLMNLPFQTCPFCVPNTDTLSNTIAVDAQKIEYTTAPVKVTGKLVFGDFTDDYGYQYSYKIIDAEMQILDETEISEKTRVYYTVSEKDYVVDVYNVIEAIFQVAYYDEMNVDPNIFSQFGPIPFERYEEIKSTLEKLNTNKEYNEFIFILNRAEETRVKLNKDLAENNTENYLNYKTAADELFDAFTEFTNKYSF